MDSKKKSELRLRRKKRVRKNVKGSDSVPRLTVFKSNKFTYAQLISDESNKVIAGLSTRQLEGDSESSKSVRKAKALGEAVAEIAEKFDISSAIFDRNGYRYHGRVAAVAEGAREKGLIR